VCVVAENATNTSRSKGLILIWGPSDTTNICAFLVLMISHGCSFSSASGSRFPAAVSEMLVQSTMTDLYLLPALPRDKWAKGCVKGLQARGGNTVNICWDKGDLQEVGLWLKKDGSCSLQRLHYRGTTVTTSLSSGIIYTFNSQLQCIKSFSLSEVAFPRV
jgi:hypothetical protein